MRIQGRWAFFLAPRGRGGDIFCAAVLMGDRTTIMAAAVKAAYLPAFTSASLRVIFSLFTGMFFMLSKARVVYSEINLNAERYSQDV